MTGGWRSWLPGGAPTTGRGALRVEGSADRTAGRLLPRTRCVRVQLLDTGSAGSSPPSSPIRCRQRLNTTAWQRPTGSKTATRAASPTAGYLHRRRPDRRRAHAHPRAHRADPSLHGGRRPPAPGAPERLGRPAAARSHLAHADAPPGPHMHSITAEAALPIRPDPRRHPRHPSEHDRGSRHRCPQPHEDAATTRVGLERGSAGRAHRRARPCHLLPGADAAERAGAFVPVGVFAARSRRGQRRVLAAGLPRRWR